MAARTSLEVEAKPGTGDRPKQALAEPPRIRRFDATDA